MNHFSSRLLWDKVFKNGRNKICGRQPSKTWSDIVCLNKPYHLEFFKGCLPQILPGPLLNTLSPFTQPMQNSEYADKVKYNSKMLHLGIKNDEHKKEWKVTQSCQVKLD